MSTPTKPSCKLCQRQPGRCPTHDVDLSARNRRVALARQINDPKAEAQRLHEAGKAGFKAACKKVGRDKVIARLQEASQQYRRDNPSGPERYAHSILNELGIEYQVEVPLPGNKSIDIVIGNLAVFVNGHQWKPSFGETKSRHQKQMESTAIAKSEGYQVLILDWRKHRNWKGQLVDVTQNTQASH